MTRDRAPRTVPHLCHNCSTFVPYLYLISRIESQILNLCVFPNVLRFELVKTIGVLKRLLGILQMIPRIIFILATRSSTHILAFHWKLDSFKRETRHITIIELLYTSYIISDIISKEKTTHFLSMQTNIHGNSFEFEFFRVRCTFKRVYLLFILLKKALD